jgi:hypothetical protein
MRCFDVVVIGGGHAVPPFPTRSEIRLSLLEQAGV